MKRTALMMLFFAMLLSAFADNIPFDDGRLRYVAVSEEDKTCEVYEPVGPMSQVVVPEYVDYNGEKYKVIGIGARAFYKSRKITSVVLPETIEYIGTCAFDYCYDLNSITIPKSLKAIGDCAFNNIDNLGVVYISDLKSWCDIDFDSASANPLNYARNLYLNKRRINDLVIPEGVTVIKPYAFVEGEFTSVTFPSSLQTIGDGAFWDSKYGDTLTIGENIISIGNRAFSNSYDLMNLVINEGVTSIGDNAFESCLKVTSITLPESLTSIGSRAFYNCINVRTCTLPESLSSIGSEAFGKCTSLHYITIPSGIKSISDGMFEGCKNLRTVNLAADVTSIGSGAFKDCISLSSFNIPQQVSSIAPSTFEGCTGLLSITIPASVTSIGNNAFKDCSSLSSVNLPASLTTVGAQAFMNCIGMSGITIPAAVESIGESAFAGITVNPVVECNTLPEIGSKGFNTDATLYIHQGVSVPVYSLWATFDAIKYIETDENIVKTIDDYTYLFDHAVKQACVTHCANSSLSTAAIPTMVTSGGKSYPVTSIGREAFAGCASLKSVTIPGTVNTIGEGSFYGCTGVRNLHIADSATPLVCSSALDMSAVTELYLGRDIDWSVLKYMKELDTVTLGNTVTSIPDNALKDCSLLSWLIIGSGVTEIGELAFHGGSFNTEIVIPSNVKTIGMNAFFGSSFEMVYIGAGLSSVGKFAFYGSHPSEVYITAPKAPKASDVVFSALGAGTLYAQTEDALQSYTAAKDRWDHFADFKTMVVAESILTSQEPLHYEAGTTQQLTATVMPEDATLKQIFWRSTNPEIATVSTTGLVTYHRVFDEDGNYVPASEEALADLRIIATTLYADGPAMAFSTKEVYNGVETVIPETADGELDYTAPLDVYNLSGLRVAGSIDGLARGIYIVRQGSVVEKIAVK